MITSKFKLISYWLLYIVGFYLLWLLAYLLAARFIIREASRFVNPKGFLPNDLKPDDGFWYFVFLAGIAIACYLFKSMMDNAPKPKVAAVIYILLIVASVGLLVEDQWNSLRGQLFVHVFVNLVFTIPMFMRLLQTRHSE
jgi:hypothetical protein